MDHQWLCRIEVQQPSMWSRVKGKLIDMLYLFGIAASITVALMASR